MIPFGLTNAPSTFTRLVNEVLKFYLCNFVVVYLDDVRIYSKSELERLEHLKLIFEALHDQQLCGKLENFLFMLPNLVLLGMLF